MYSIRYFGTVRPLAIRKVLLLYTVLRNQMRSPIRFRYITNWRTGQYFTTDFSWFLELLLIADSSRITSWGNGHSSNLKGPFVSYTHCNVLQLWFFTVLFFAAGFCMKFCHEGYEENFIKTGLLIVVVIPFTVGPIFTLIIGDLLYVV